MSIVNLKCSNHNLTLGSTPILASGSQNVDTISVEFDESWDSYGVKEAIFWRATEPNVAYRQIFENYASTAVIPANVLAEKGNIIFCLRGMNGDDIITTTVVTLDVVEGVAVEGRDPSIEPSVYDEILKELQNIRLTCGEQIIEQNEKRAIELWVGSQAKYDALETEPTDTLCIITDEVGSKELLEQATAAVEEANKKISNIDLLSMVQNYSTIEVNSGVIKAGKTVEFNVSAGTSYRFVYVRQSDPASVAYKTVKGGAEGDPEGLLIVNGQGTALNDLEITLIPDAKSTTSISLKNARTEDLGILIRPYVDVDFINGIELWQSNE